MKKISIKMVVNLSIIAALYVALTLGFAPLSYGPIQFRFSEALIILVLYKKEYAISLILGCFVSNCFSTLGMPDIIFGTLATVVAIIPMLFIKNKWIASLFPTLANALIVGAELAIIFDLPYFMCALEVGFGEFVVVSLIGLALFKGLEESEIFLKLIDVKQIEKEEKKPTFFDGITMLSIAVSIMLIVLYFTLPLWRVIQNEGLETEEIINYTLFNLTFGVKDYLVAKYYYLIVLFVPILLFMGLKFKNKLVRNSLTIILTILLITLLIVALASSWSYGIEFTFFLYFAVSLIYLILTGIKNKQAQLI